MSPSYFHNRETVFFDDNGKTQEAIILINFWGENYALIGIKNWISDYTFFWDEFYVEKSNLTKCSE